MEQCLVEVVPSKIQYPAAKESTLLDAALANGLFLQHSCKKGQCGVCVAEVLSGLVKNEHGMMVTCGEVLTCCSYAQSNATIKAQYYPQLAQIECKTMPCKVASIQNVADDIIILTLRLPPNAQLQYLAGQYIDLLYDGIRRSYSIANHDSSQGVELHIRLLPNGELSQRLAKVAANQLMRLEGPKGTFFVRQSDHPLIFLAGGTGFAPVKAMVEKLLSEQDARQIYIYWGMSSANRLYTDIAERWASLYSQVTYVPVVSQPDEQWQGRKGLVHEAILQDFEDLAAYHVYACGSQPMLEIAETQLMQHGLIKEHFFKDAFVSSN